MKGITAHAFILFFIQKQNKRLQIQFSAWTTYFYGAFLDLKAILHPKILSSFTHS